MESNVFIGLGSNVGDRELNLLKAVAELGKLLGSRVTALSSFFDTEPVGMDSGDNFLNAVVKMESSLSVEDLLSQLMQIETTVFGRQRSGSVDSRRMDLDILFYGDKVIDSPPRLVIPHPRLNKRKFVLEPLAEIAPGFIHPLLGKSVSSLLSGLDDTTRVTKV
ncbi:MAG: 2-amino-4-hydroxy-6-hydroxymethyldihydropteridine diphosphokinase [Geobacteraceae bacterium]|nr:2-amino-4-hydroxy-6-hydroxymethyldihydropteridine diphosphokinase [Geobacteraceae bacterium]